MKLPFAEAIPQQYYEMSLDEARQLLSPQDAALVSIKVRPIQRWPIESAHSFANAYMYPNEYEAAFKLLSKANIQVVREGSVSRGHAQAFAANDGSEFLFVRHESGPEIIAYLGLATASISLLTSIVQLVTELAKKVNQNNEAVKRGRPKERSSEVAAISIEARHKDSARIIKIIKLPLDYADLDIEGEIRKIL